MNLQKTKYNKIETLLPRFCEGLATEQEKLLIEEWMAEDELNRKQVNQIHSIYLAIDTLNILKTIDTEKALKNTKKKTQNIQSLYPSSNTSKRYILRTWLSIAASFALLLVFFYFYIIPKEPKDNFLKIAQEMKGLIPKDESTKVSLFFSDTEKIEVDNNSKIVYSTNGQVNINTNQLTRQADKVTYNQIIVPKGKRSQIVLADNSKIWINSDSRLVYPTSFTGKYREIFVEGEAYLEVAHNADIPFIVKTSGFTVQVLGTSFNVSAYKGEKNASVVLVSGSVNIEDEEKHQIKMSPNECVELTQNTISSKKNVDVTDYISWVKGLWILKGEPLGKVVKLLEKYYGVKIQYDHSFADKRIYGELFLNNDINQVIQSIIAALPLNFYRKNDTIFIEQLH